jgi:RNA polymerase sigma-70 factor (ECF subfamily)
MRETTMQRDGMFPVPERPPGMTSTIDLLERFKQGDDDAVSLLVERSIPPLKRWARGRLPHWARSLAETQDLVQNAVLRALPHLKTFEARHPGALQAYLRQAVDNHIKDEIRKVKARPAPAPLSDEQPDEAPSPLERAIGAEGMERYEAALKTLRPLDREAIIARCELQQSYEEIAIALDKPSADAARMAVVRALKNLLKAMAGIPGRAGRPGSPGPPERPDHG